MIAAPDKDLSKVGVALRRAAKQAKKEAERTHTPLIVYEQGRVKRKMVKKEIGVGNKSQEQT